MIRADSREVFVSPLPKGLTHGVLPQYGERKNCPFLANTSSVDVVVGGVKIPPLSRLVLIERGCEWFLSTFKLAPMAMTEAAKLAGAREGATTVYLNLDVAQRQAYAWLDSLPTPPEGADARLARNAYLAAYQAAYERRWSR